MARTTQAVRIEDNRLRPDDRAAHDWYRFVLSFPAHLVRHYVSKFQIAPDSWVLDPFCGTGTTLVECKKLGIRSIGIEANPIAHFASQVKTDWSPNPSALLEHARQVAKIARNRLEAEGLDETGDLPLFSSLNRTPTAPLRMLPPEPEKLLLKDSISPVPLHKTLVLLDTIEERKDVRFYAHERLAVAKALVSGISNLRFGPEVGLGKVREDAPVVTLWTEIVRSMTIDLSALHAGRDVETVVHRADSRHALAVLAPQSVAAVITSPPYPNEKDYTRTTRLESVLLGFLRNKRDLRELKRTLVRSNTRGVYSDDRDDEYILGHSEIEEIADAIEARRVELGKTSGFERLYARVTKLYFGGMARHLRELQAVLRPGAQLAYVVGDQASYLRVHIRTGHLLADIAASLGYEVVGTDLFRTRQATATREELREEVVLLRWPERGASGVRGQ